MLLHSLEIDAAEFADRTGWEAKPEGLCKGDICVPAPDARLKDGRLDARVIADRVGMPLVHDGTRGIWALGPASGGHALASAEAADPPLIDADGNPFLLSSLHGRKVLLVAWASW